jgi:hypothetical protein
MKITCLSSAALKTPGLAGETHRLSLPKELLRMYRELHQLRAVCTAVLLLSAKFYV